jgi:hypothetical protein
LAAEPAVAAADRRRASLARLGLSRRRRLRPRLLAAVIRSKATLAFAAERQVVGQTSTDAVRRARGFMRHFDPIQDLGGVEKRRRSRLASRLHRRRGMKRPAGTATIVRAKWLLGAFGLLALARCGPSQNRDPSQDGGPSQDGSQERGIWSTSSVDISFTLNGPLRNRLCGFSATREELSSEQIQGLSSLRLQDGRTTSGCDIPTYVITVRAGDGSSATYFATDVYCSTEPILLFADFEAWARSTPCSLQSLQP